MNLQQIAKVLNVEAKGPAEYPVKGVRDIERLSLDESLEDHYIYFIESPAVFKRHPKAVDGGIILTTPALADQFRHALVAPQSDIRLALIALLRHFDKTPAFKPGISPQAHVDPSAKIADSAVIHAGAVVMEGAVVGAKSILYPNVVVESFAEIGDGSVLFPCVVIGHHCMIGKNVIIHGGTVIGADGFGFYDQPGKRYKIPQIGNVVIDEEVEIGASCTVDRATIESTRIGAYTKLDDQVHVGHNAQLGRFIYIVGNSAIGGSVTIGDGAMISGMVIVKDHLKIGAGSIVMGMSGVAQDTEPKTAYFGTPARPAKQMHRMNAALEKLPELLSKFRTLMPLLAILWVAAGCSGVDKMDRKMDVASEHMRTEKPVYEGPLASSKAVGALISLQFVDGQTYEVYDAPSALTHGDIIRIYKTDKGYEAHLWRESQEKILPAAPSPQ